MLLKQGRGAVLGQGRRRQGTSYEVKMSRTCTKYGCSLSLFTRRCSACGR